MGLLAPDPAIDVLSAVEANEGWTPAEEAGVADGFALEGGMREEGRLGGRVSPAWAKEINFIAWEGKNHVHVHVIALRS